MEFHEKRRQQFLDESLCKEQLLFWEEMIRGQRLNLSKPEGSERGWHCSLLKGIADEMFISLVLKYTAGEPIEPMRLELEAVVAAYERYGGLLWKYRENRNEAVFELASLDDYCEMMQLIGLCFLLHRRDLLPRIAILQDGDTGFNGGADTIYEELMIHAMGAESRHESEHACQIRPYENLFYALTEEAQQSQLKALNLFLKHWYKDLAGTAWHDSHKPDEAGNQGGYYGYWSFEAGAAVLLLGIEDDSSLHKYLYYPKDLVAWARAHSSLSGAATRGDLVLRCAAGEPCPREGRWFSPAQPHSRRRFALGVPMPDLGGDYGRTVWQWDAAQ